MMHVAVSPALIEALAGKPLLPEHFQDLGSVDGQSYIPGHETPLLAMLHCHIRMTSAAQHHGPQKLSWLTASCLPLPRPLQLQLFSVPVQLGQLGDVMSRQAGEAAVAHWVMTESMVQNLTTEEGKRCEVVLIPKEITGVRQAFFKRKAEEISAEIAELEAQQEQVAERLTTRRAHLNALKSEDAPSMFKDW